MRDIHIPVDIGILIPDSKKIIRCTRLSSTFEDVTGRADNVRGDQWTGSIHYTLILVFQHLIKVPFSKYRVYVVVISAAISEF